MSSTYRGLSTIRVCMCVHSCVCVCVCAKKSVALWRPRQSRPKSSKQAIGRAQTQAGEGASASVQPYTVGAALVSEGGVRAGDRAATRDGGMAGQNGKKRSQLLFLQRCSKVSADLRGPPESGRATPSAWRNLARSMQATAQLPGPPEIAPTLTVPCATEHARAHLGPPTQK